MFLADPTGLHTYLVVSALLFVLGLIACMARRNAIGILIGIELILNAAILNFMVFWHFRGGQATDSTLAGPMMGIFLIVLAACEAAIALAVLLNLYFNFGTVEVDSIRRMKR
ncbi:NADH-quinone oxidoreductase subunit NuoK [Candidatus Sumerlaeota bacterium]|nr:NADH-quinone oxidoreductase subunit NuoK [Candidatus Sumerlaeota bacterium]